MSDDGTQLTATVPAGTIGLADVYIRNPAGQEGTLSNGFTYVEATAPTVTATTPASGATDAAVTTTITATFSEAMDSSTITATTFTLDNGVTGSVTYNSDTATFTLTTGTSLSQGTTYTATVSTGAQDLAGNALASDYSWTFTTVSAVTPAATNNDPTAPLLVSPADGATGVALAETFSWRTSVDLDWDTINYDFYLCPDSDFSGSDCSPTRVGGTLASSPDSPHGQSGLFSPSFHTDFSVSSLASAGMGVVGYGVVLCLFLFTIGLGRTRETGLVITALTVAGSVALLYSCGEFIERAPMRGESTSAVISISLPQGVTRKPDGRLLSDNGSYAPTTMTSITCSITGPGMGALSISIPVDTLEASMEIPSGLDRLFFLTVTTENGDEYTGSATVDLEPGAVTDISITVDKVTVTIGGILSAAVPSSKTESGQGPLPRYGVESWAGANIVIINSSGTVIGSVTASSDGSFSVDVTPGLHYIIRASIGNLVLKQFITSATGSDSLGGFAVDPQSTALVKALAFIMGNPDLGEEGIDLGSFLSALDISSTITTIFSDSTFAAIAAAIQQEITNSYDPLGTSGSIGSAGIAGNDLILTLASQLGSEMTHTANLSTNTTYYWKVTANDGNGGTAESETRSFTTGAF